MQFRQLGKSGFTISALGLGCMGMSAWYGPTNSLESTKTIYKAFEMGINFFDTADVYGNGENEKLLGNAVRSFRDQIVIASKCGVVAKDNSLSVNGSPDYIKKACDASLQCLGVDYIDLYYLHRIDPNTPIEESMQAMNDLLRAGKIRSIGLSEADENTIRRANNIHSLAAIQTEYSIGTRQAAEKIIPVCNELGIAFIAYSPVGRGLLSGKIRNIEELTTDDWRRQLPHFQNLKINLKLVSALEKIASQKNNTVAQLVLAWLLVKHDNVIPITGTSKLQHLEENIKAVDILLSDKEMLALEEASLNMPLQGERLPAELMKAFQLDV
jgi:aryl-alcohol dehydrogenase-like predicted oxidoreductase